MGDLFTMNKYIQSKTGKNSKLKQNKKNKLNKYEDMKL